MGAFRKIAIGLLLSTAFEFAVGQADQKRPGTSAVPAVKPKSSPQIEKLLASLEGTWSIREKLAPNPASPSGTGEGKIVWSRGPGGFSVIEDQSWEGSRDVTGLGVFWWDEAAQGYRTIWCDSTNPGGCISFKNPLRWDGSRLELVEDYEVNGKQVTFKEIIDGISSSTFTQTLYGGETGKELNIDQTIKATRLTSRTHR